MSQCGVYGQGWFIWSALDHGIKVERAYVKDLDGFGTPPRGSPLTTHRKNKTTINDTKLDRDGPERTGIDANDKIAPKRTVHKQKNSAQCPKMCKKAPRLNACEPQKRCAALASPRQRGAMPPPITPPPPMSPTPMSPPPPACRARARRTESASARNQRVGWQGVKVGDMRRGRRGGGQAVSAWVRFDFHLAPAELDSRRRGLGRVGRDRCEPQACGHRGGESRGSNLRWEDRAAVIMPIVTVISTAATPQRLDLKIPAGCPP